MMMNRREFIKVSGSTLVAAGVMGTLKPLTAGGMQLRPAKNKIGIGSLTGEETEIVRLASLAPSGHNTQPWTVRIIGPGHWVIGTEKNRWLPAVDPENREMMLSMGAFLENMIVAAGIHGYKLDYRVMARNAFEKDVLGITLRKTSPGGHNTSTIEQRRTLRNGFLPVEITGKDFSAMTLGLGGSGLYLPVKSVQGRYLAQGTIEANRVQAWREPAQQELADWIRWTDREVEKHLNGLTPSSMEIHGLAGWYVRHFFNRSSVMSESFRKKGVDMVRKQVDVCGGWIIITSPDDTVATLLETGRAFQRMALRARGLMIALHPMTQMLEETPWRKTVAKELGITQRIQFILRAGYVKTYPAPVSVRMPLERILAG